MSHILTFPQARKSSLLVQYNTQERSVDLKSAVVLDESELSKFVHEKIDPGTRCADHLRQRFLRHFGEYSVGLVFLTVTGQQQKSAREPLLARVEELIDQILLDSNVPCQHEFDEPVRAGMLLVKHFEHFILFNDKHGAGRNRGSGAHAKALTCQVAFSKEVARSQHPHDCHSADFIDNGELYIAILNVHHTRSGITLRVDFL
jgi:hypothetical protein